MDYTVCRHWWFPGDKVRFRIQTKVTSWSPCPPQPLPAGPGVGCEVLKSYLGKRSFVALYQFPCCKHSHHGQLQDARMMPRSEDEGGDKCRWLSQWSGNPRTTPEVKGRPKESSHQEPRRRSSTQASSAPACSLYQALVINYVFFFFLLWWGFFSSKCYWKILWID